MSLLGYIVKRIGQALPILLGITIVSFLLLRLVPGDPAVAILGTNYTEERATEVRNSLGLNMPLLQQYWNFLSHAVRFDFGNSYSLHRPVIEEIWHRLPKTAFLIVFTGVLTLIITIPIGTVSALRQGGVFDNTARGFFLLAYATPGFVTGILLLQYLSAKLHWFAISGFGTGFFDNVYHTFLPALTMSLAFSTVLVRSLRATVLDVLRSDYIITARLKGTKWAAVLRRDMLPNALLPLTVVFGVNLAFMVGGTVIMENVFSIPGLGKFLVDAVPMRDYFVIQGTTLVFAVLVLLVNMLTDIIHVSLDPRLSLGVV
ncbi:MAG: ABC transporter permease [Propionibacteriaceae bacterium]|jgi:peptide/nickel transport system permease protein|nr:ABC transporter permease [Propionibacteriaceae bacterium]